MATERIIFLSSKNPFSHKDWSGIPYYLKIALSRYYDVEVIKLPNFTSVKLAAYYWGKIFFFLFKKKYVFDYGSCIAILYGLYSFFIIPRDRSRYKFIFCPAGLTETAMLWTNIPIVNYGDCSTLQMLDYYPSLMEVTPISHEEIKWVERKAIKKSSLMIMSSQWAADFIEREYKKTCHVIAFGANITERKFEHNPSKYPTRNAVNLLLIGMDWDRKGASHAIDLHNQLIQAGVNSKLTIVGMQPTAQIDLPESIIIIPHINKDSAYGQTMLNSIWEQTHFFVLPTNADCTPIVIAEAFANAIPVMATNTGGISSMVTTNVTGILFDLGNIKMAADYILQLISDPLEYVAISQKCLQSYRNQFNWSSWAQSLRELESKLLS